MTLGPTPEQRARAEIDRLLTAAGWTVQDLKAADIHAARGVALREFVLNPGFGTGDYLLYVGGKACGVIEAKKRGATPFGVEAQSGSKPKARLGRQPSQTGAACQATINSKCQH